MIIGIGTDILEISRIQKVVDRTPDFPKRILTKSEMDEYINAPDQINFLAKRFSVKEACSKALGCGIGQNLSFTDMEISHTPSGAPILKIKTKPNYQIHLSISDEKDFVVSFVVIEEKS